MSVTREVTIWCDDCLEWDQQSGVKVMAFRKELKEKGWTHRREDGRAKDYCPTCSAKRKG
jgi:hypothetical protein